ncbi:MAG: hypothetical protein WCG20_04025 [bacterium]
MLKKIIIVCTLCVMSRGYAQVSPLALAARSHTVARVVRDTLTWKQVDSLGRGWCLYERVSSDSVAPVLFTARMLYILFSPTLEFPGILVEEVNNAFGVVFLSDTVVMTLPSSDHESCIREESLNHMYQGVCKYKPKYWGTKKLIPFEDTVCVTANEVVTIELLGRENQRHLTQVTLTGRAELFDRNLDQDRYYDNEDSLLFMMRIPISSGYSIKSAVGGSPVTNAKGFLVGITTEIIWVSEEDRIRYLFLLWKKICKSP